MIDTVERKLLYVLCSRAKKNLYLFSEYGRTTKNGLEYSSTDELSLMKCCKNGKAQTSLLLSRVPGLKN